MNTMQRSSPNTKSVRARALIVHPAWNHTLPPQQQQERSAMTMSSLPNCVLHAIASKLDSGVDVASLELTSQRCRLVVVFGVG